MSKDLFGEIQLPLGSRLKNRIVMSPMTTESGYFDGGIPQELIEYYASRSGEAGAIIVESCFVEEHGRGFDGALGIHTDERIEDLRELAQAIKRKGSKAIVQIYHAGRMAFPHMNGGAIPISASPVAALRPNAPVPSEMTHQDVLSMIQLFADATRRAILAGFDGVEIHGANTYLVQQFFSPHSNRRSDAWGGNNEKRSKFPLEVLKAVKDTVKKYSTEPFIVGYRFSPEELEEPGIRFSDTMFLLEKLAQEGVDYLHFSMATYKRSSIVDTQDDEYLVQKVINQRSEVLANIPLIGVGNVVQQADANDALELGYDLIAVGKAFLVEPHWVQKIRNQETVRLFADVNQRESLLIPRPLWKFMDQTFNLVKDVEKEKQKAERLKTLMSKPLVFQPGTVEVLAKGHNNDLPMFVTFDEKGITDISIDSSAESEGLSDMVFEKMPQQIISFQTLNVDAVSGASTTSQGVIDGVAQAVRIAGGDDNVEVMLARPKPEVKRSTAVIEKDTDVLVIGGGAAGIAASLRSDELGLSTILIEKLSFIGGAISVSGGNQVVMGSKLQRQAGVTDDSVALMVEDFKKNGNGKNSEELLTLLAENIGQTTDWVSEYVGVPYAMDEGLHILAEYQKNRELAYAHGGHGFAAAVRKKIAESGVELFLQTKVERLTTSQAGDVNGAVAVAEDGTTYHIHAKAVVLTTGGFGNNKALLSDELKNVLFYGTRSSMGEGLMMARVPEIDAATCMMEYGKIYPNGIEVAPGVAKSTIGGNIAVLRENGLLVNSHGHRVVNERASNHDILDVLMKQSPQMLYILLDQKHFDIFKVEVAEGGISQVDINQWLENNGSTTPYFYHADSLEELAQLAGMDSDALTNTVSRYNRFVRNQEDTDFNRQKQFLQVEVGEGPYYLIEQKPRFATTMGGLVVDTNLSVLNTKGNAVKGLFAAGEVVGGVMGTDSPSGANNAWALTSGKLAAESIAK